MGFVQDKVVIITGAASGLGLADAVLLAAEGAHVVMTDRNEALGYEAAATIPGAVFMAHDVTQEADWARVIDATLAQHGRIDVLVNNAGINVAATIEETSLEDFRRVSAVIAEGTFLGCKTVLPAMIAGGGGSIINIASTATKTGVASFTAYGAAKGAVAALTKAVAVHCKNRGYGIRCNSVHPGTAATPMVTAMRAAIAAKGLPPVRPNGTPIAFLDPGDVAGTVLFLASDLSRAISGAEIVVDDTATIQ